MLFLGNVVLVLLIFLVYQTESSQVYETDSNHEFCNIPIETIQKSERNINISNIEKCRLCTNKSKKCFEGGDSSELFGKDKEEKDYLTFLSIEPTSREKKFCYFCISEYNSSLQNFTFNQNMQSNDTFNDIVWIKYGDDSQLIPSVFKKWLTRLKKQTYRNKNKKKYILSTLLGKKKFITYSWHKV